MKVKGKCKVNVKEKVKDKGNHKKHTQIYESMQFSNGFHKIFIEFHTRSMNLYSFPMRFIEFS